MKHRVWIVVENSLIYVSEINVLVFLVLIVRTEEAK